VKGVTCPQYGLPEVLKIVEVPKPTPYEDEVLIRWVPVTETYR
jgi:NADPH:quinone reductase-like Zn-dependent oxidoreductase